MQSKRLDERLSVSEQIEPADIPALKKAGFASVIVNRPDGEAEGQPAFAEIAAAAGKAGMKAAYLPVVPGQISDEQAARFARLLATLPGPVLGYCRTGTRSASLWALAEAEKGRAADELIGQAAASGCDLTGLRDRLAKAGE